MAFQPSEEGPEVDEVGAIVHFVYFFKIYILNELKIYFDCFFIFKKVLKTVCFGFQTFK
jgi:hypothetical protein